MPGVCVQDEADGTAVCGRAPVASTVRKDAVGPAAFLTLRNRREPAPAGASQRKSAQARRPRVRRVTIPRPALLIAFFFFNPSSLCVSLTEKIFKQNREGGGGDAPMRLHSCCACDLVATGDRLSGPSARGAGIIERI